MKKMVIATLLAMGMVTHAFADDKTEKYVKDYKAAGNAAGMERVDTLAKGALTEAQYSAFAIAVGIGVASASNGDKQSGTGTTTGTR
ncbi:hypothetical protein IB286_02365 [Spongiibacter sp. KMU-158]|uniref:Uncharacterized protein n=1 Tax=Spongiibacter pelagi TaxID=2760804 RepID=A0A927BYE0_9GAMM|nr:hypothetical protein [Spongiibacter pelagi]MBD2857835.1 hypothetical protein [Spongiibacter pelagi]